MKLIHTYHPHFSGGIGDFLRGSIYLHKLCQQRNIEMYIDWTKHKICKYISSYTNNINHDDKLIFDIEELTIKSKMYLNLSYMHRQRKIINYILDNSIEIINMSSYYIDIYDNINGRAIKQTIDYEIPPHTQKYMQNNIVISDRIKLLHDKIFSNKKYGTIHFRLGDKHTLPNIDKKFDSLPHFIRNHPNLKNFDHNYDYLYSLIEKNIATNNFQYIVLLSDSNDFKKYVQKQNNEKIIIPHFQSNHSSVSPGLLKFSNYQNKQSSEQLKNVALDIEILINSQKNISYSVYPWGSGFSVWPSKIFNIPLEIREISP